MLNLFLTRLHLIVAEQIKRLEIDPGSISGAHCYPLTADQWGVAIDHCAG